MNIHEKDRSSIIYYFGPKIGKSLFLELLCCVTLHCRILNFQIRKRNKFLLVIKKKIHLKNETLYHISRTVWEKNVIIFVDYIIYNFHLKLFS